MFFFFFVDVFFFFFFLFFRCEQAMFDDAVRLCASAKYLNAGTVEFLVDQKGRCADLGGGGVTTT